MYIPTADDRLEAIEKALELLGLTKTTKKVKCFWCNGTGKVYHSVGHNSHEEDVCPKCEGVGKINKPHFIKEDN